MFLNLLHLVSIRNVSTIAMYCNSIVLFKPTIVIAIVLFNNSNTSIHCNTFHTIAMDNTLLTIPDTVYNLQHVHLLHRPDRPPPAAAAAAAAGT